MLAAGTKVDNWAEAVRLARTGNLVKMFRSLQFLARCAGHTKEPYSVFLHTLFGVQYFMNRGEEQLAKEFALHDLHECVIGDIPRPLKVDQYKQFGDDFDSHLRQRFGLDPNWASKEVTELDKTIIREEFLVFGLDGWQVTSESKIPMRDDVMVAIREVLRHAKLPSQLLCVAFGRATAAPERLVLWLQGSRSWSNVLDGLRYSEGFTYDIH